MPKQYRRGYHAFAKDEQCLCAARILTRRCPSWVDAVEKVLGIAALRNNRIMADDFLNPSCVFGAYLELILLGDPLKIFFRQYRSSTDQKVIKLCTRIAQ